MSKKHWITRKEAKELYSMSDNKLRQLSKLGLVDVKFGKRKGTRRGRRPQLWRRSQLELFVNMKPKQIDVYHTQLNEPENADMKKVTDFWSKQDFQKGEKDNNDIEAVVAQECESKYQFTYLKTVDHPEHYNNSSLEVIDAIDAWNLNFSEGNIIKYVIRAKYKNSRKEDLEKALWYIQRLLENC